MKSAATPYEKNDASRMGKTIAAVLAAILLITGAIWIRQSRSTTENVTAQPDNKENGSAGTEKPMTLICTIETEQACQQLQDNPKIEKLGIAISIENPGKTSQDFIDSENIQPTLWLTAQPWADITAAERQRLGKPQRITTQSKPIASSPFVLAIWKERAAALEKTCAPITWRCLGDTAGKSWSSIQGKSAWGNLKPGHPPADETTAGLYSTIALTNAYFTDQSYAANDFSDRQFRSWFSNFSTAVPDFTPIAGTPLDQMLLTGPASYDYAATIRPQATEQIAASRQRDKIELIETDLAVTLQLVSLSNADASEVEPLLPTLLSEAGWETQTIDSSPLPNAGVMQALIALWKQTS